MKTSGTLYIVATPIGNLEDITLRALRTLKEVDLIAAEDTRYTRKLLTHFNISKPLTSYFDHNKHLKGEAILDRLRNGASVALVSDAGTPCIADPGYQLVRDAVAEGISVIPIPGASAAVAALSASGLPTDCFTFIGFLPSKQGKRRQLLSSVRGEERVLIFYEAPGRLMSTLGDMREILGERYIVVARELTKIYEEFARGTTTEVIARFADRQVKGEVVILVASVQESEQEVAGTCLREILQRHLFLDGLSLKDAVKRASIETKLPRSEVYSEALKIRAGVCQE